MSLATPTTGRQRPQHQDPWQGLAVELDRWTALGRPATLWWRDDDAALPAPQFSKLLDLLAKHNQPLALAVIPHDASDELAQLIAQQAAPLAVLQHGYAHQNHAGADEKSIELGRHRPTPYILADLATGQQRLAGFPGSLPILVPPWNRIAPHLLPMLPEIGITGISTFGPRSEQPRLTGLARTNTHVDIVNWRGDCGFVGTITALERLTHMLHQRRTGLTDINEPTGLLTHHLIHTPDHWAFIDQLLTRTTAHPAVRWLSVSAAFETDHE